MTGDEYRSPGELATGALTLCVTVQQLMDAHPQAAKGCLDELEAVLRVLERATRGAQLQPAGWGPAQVLQFMHAGPADAAQLQRLMGTMLSQLPEPMAGMLRQLMGQACGPVVDVPPR